METDAENEFSFKDENNFSYKKESKEQVIGFIKKFFEKKDYWAGGSIPLKKMLSEINVFTVMQLNILDGFEIAYKCLETQKPQNYSTDGEKWDIDLCYGVLTECQNLRIPKCYTAGMILVYLFLCQGIDYVEELKKYSVYLNGKYSFDT